MLRGRARLGALLALLTLWPAVGEGHSPDPRELDAVKPPEIYAIDREVFVLAEPNAKAKKLGYLRAGGHVVRSVEANSFEGCPGGFFRVAPEGFVCAGAGTELEPSARVQSLLTQRPDRLSPLPYVYARVGGTPPFYAKLPSASEQRAAEPDLPRRRGIGFDELSPDALPAWLAEGTPTPTPFGYKRAGDSVVVGRALAGSSFAVLGMFDQGTRRFGLVDDLTLVPLDRTERVTGSDFHGLALEEGMSLPVAFVMQKGAALYARGENPRALRRVRTLDYREVVAIQAERVSLGGVEYVETLTGELFRAAHARVVALPSELPYWTKFERPWIRVSIKDQTLVAYRGSTPVYVTLVSTGVDGLGDPATTRSTVRGQFRIHTKHVTAPMSGNQAGDEYDLRDVPWIQYFSANYAFHAAYWHDAFGTPRSHGCINLSPRDARFLFHFTEPPVPQAWHGAFSLLEGTLVEITE